MELSTAHRASDNHQARFFAICPPAPPRTPPQALQDALLLICSSLFALLLASHAFLRQNSYELLACVALAVVPNLPQLVLLGTALPANGGQLALLAACLLLLAGEVALAYYTHSTFGWRTFGLVSCDLRVKGAEEGRAALLRLHLFGALAKLDGQVSRA